MRIRDVAILNPPVTGLDREARATISFLPLDKIWADERFDPNTEIDFCGDLGSYNAVAEGDVLLPKVAPTFAHGRVAIAHGLIGGRALATSEVFVLRTAGATDARFLAYRLRARDFISHGVASWTGVAGLKRVSADFVRNTRLARQAWANRSTIAGILDRQCQRIAAVQAATTCLVARASVPALELAKREFEQQPHGRIGYRFDVQLGKMLDERHIDRGDTRPYLRNANVHWDEVRLIDLKRMTFDATDRRKFQLQRGDLLVCEGGEPGRAAVWNGDLDDCYYQKALHRVRPYESDSTRYLLWALRVLSDRNAFAVDGPGRYTHLTAEMLRAVRVPMPSPEVQHQRAEQIDAVAAHARSLATTASTLRCRLVEYRDALITEAVTGQLDVTAVSEQQMDERLHEAVEAAGS